MIILIYIDNDYKCHVSNDGKMQAIDVSFLDGKCSKYIEGYQYIPPGKTWIREDGTEFAGEMIAPWRDYTLLAELQTQYEETSAQIQTALEILGM